MTIQHTDTSQVTYTSHGTETSAAVRTAGTFCFWHSRIRSSVSGAFIPAGGVAWGAGEPGEAAEGNGAAGKVHLSRTRQKKG